MGMSHIRPIWSILDRMTNDEPRNDQSKEPRSSIEPRKSNIGLTHIHNKTDQKIYGERRIHQNLMAINIFDHIL